MQLKEEAMQLKVEAMQQKVDMHMINGELHTHTLSINFLFLLSSLILSEPYLS